MKKILTFLLFVNTFYAQILDTSFDGDGKMHKQFSNSESNQVVDGGFVQPDGKIVAFGVMSAPYTDFRYIARFNADGSKDKTFNQCGFINMFQSPVTDIYLLKDGKYLVGGFSQIYKFNQDGTSDLTFGVNSAVSTNIDNTSLAITKISAQSDGKIVISGFISQLINSVIKNSFEILRLNADGTFDTTFNTKGYTIIPVGDSCMSFAHEIQNDGKIVLAGEAVVNGKNLFCLTRVTSEGVLDTTFGNGGNVITSIDSVLEDRARNLIILPTGKIFVMGASGNNLTLVRYNADGSLDTTYNGTGVNKTSNIIDYVTSLADGQNVKPKMFSDASGKIYLGYTSLNDFKVTRLLSDGITPDITFSGGNIVIHDNFDKLSILNLSKDGKVVIGGYSNSSPAVYSNDISVINFYELTNNGSVNSSKRGVLYSAFSQLIASAISPIDQSIFTFSYSMVNGKLMYGLRKMSKNGIIDVNFGDNGIYEFNNFRGNRIKIIALHDGGLLFKASNIIYKFTASGSLDTTFGTNGVLDLKKQDSKIGSTFDIMVSKENNIFLSVGYLNPQKTYYNAVIKFNLNGVKDNAFGTNGVFVFNFNTDPTNYHEVLNNISEDNKGNIICLSSTLTKMFQVTENYKSINIARLTSNGILDATFGNEGKMIFNHPLDMILSPKSILVNTNNEILIDFYGSKYNLSNSMTMQLKTDGKLDTSYGVGGIANDCEDSKSYTFAQLLIDNRLVKVSQVGINKLLISRYLTNGALDTTFGTNGKYFETLGVSYVLNDVKILSDGKLLVSGSDFDGDVQSVLFLKYTDLTLGAIDFAIDEKSMMVYPNPIENQAVFEYTLNTSENIDITLVDITGKTIKVIEKNIFKSPNTYKIDLNLDGLQTGMYFVKIKAENKGTQTLKVLKK